VAKEINNIFISHIHEDDHKIIAMKDLLAANGFNVRDSSINSSSPNRAHDRDYIKSGILAPRIRWAGAMVVLISPETRSHPWIDWEVEYAQKTDTRIVGVWTHGANECDIPEALELYADAIVGWQAERIKGAICGDISNWETSEGKVRAAREIQRISC
jgi:hypothetical protein